MVAALLNLFGDGLLWEFKLGCSGFTGSVLLILCFVFTGYANTDIIDRVD